MNDTVESMHIGLTGPMASGKGEVIRIAAELGFRMISLSEVVHREGEKRYGRPSREQLQDTGNDLRRLGGPGILGKLVAETIRSQAAGRWLIDGIRNPAEIPYLRSLKPFYLLGLGAERPIILQRLLDRRRPDDLADEAALIRRLDREWGIGEPENGQQVGRCMSQADQTIDNNGSLEELRAKVLRFLNACLQE